MNTCIYSNFTMRRPSLSKFNQGRFDSMLHSHLASRKYHPELSSTVLSGLQETRRMKALSFETKEDYERWKKADQWLSISVPLSNPSERWSVTPTIRFHPIFENLKRRMISHYKRLAPEQSNNAQLLYNNLFFFYLNYGSILRIRGLSFTCLLAFLFGSQQDTEGRSSACVWHPPI